MDTREIVRGFLKKCTDRGSYNLDYWTWKMNEAFNNRKTESGGKWTTHANTSAAVKKVFQQIEQDRANNVQRTYFGQDWYVKTLRKKDAGSEIMLT